MKPSLAALLFMIPVGIVPAKQGKHGIDIIVRLLGMVLLGIGVQLLAEGLSGLTVNLINAKVL